MDKCDKCGSAEHEKLLFDLFENARVLFEESLYQLTQDHPDISTKVWGTVILAFLTDSWLSGGTTVEQFRGSMEALCDEYQKEWNKRNLTDGR